MGKILVLLFVVALVLASVGRAESASYYFDEPSVDDSITLAWDRVDPNGDKCDRTVTFDVLMNGNWLSANEKAALSRGDMVLKSVHQGTGYDIGYVFSLAKFDPELIMGTFSSCNEHAGEQGLGDFIEKSEVIPPPAGAPKNVWRVVYQQAGSFIFSPSEYRVEDTVAATQWQGGAAYSLDSRLLDSSSAKFSPKWADSYFRVFPHPVGSFVAACNYMVPRTGMFRDQYNDTARDRLWQTGKNLLGWVNRLAKDPAASQKKREHLQLLLQP